MVSTDVLFYDIFFVLLFHFAETKRYSVIFHIINIVVTGILGIYVNISQMYLNYHIQTSILGIPVVYLGYYLKCYREKIEKYVTWWGTVFAAFVLYSILLKSIGYIELSVNSILHPLLFYPVTLVGMYFCYGMMKILRSREGSRKLFSYIGKNSFHIMALHFVAFKLVDVLYGFWSHQDSAVIEKFPHSFACWPIYYVVGVFFPMAVVSLGRYIYKKFVGELNI